LKEAIEEKAAAVVLDINTPGGEMGVTLEIMEALGKFPGDTIAYVDKEAMSAGAFISAATQEIYFAPGGIIGAAAPVTSSGGDIDQTMKEKLVSYMKGKVRAVSEGKGFRGEVVSAMIDADYELKIGDKVIKPKGGLLTLTASEASETYGDPPRPLLAAGMAKNLDALLRAKFGDHGYTVRELKVTWSEQLAVWLNAVSPILLGLGLLALFIEFKTPGFGIFGVSGILLLGLVFLSHFVAGFSGHEPVLVFGAGLLLLAVEIFFLPGTVVMAVSGLLLMLGSLVWSMADLWPNEPLRFSGDAFARPLGTLGLGVALAVVLGALLLRFLPRGWVWDKLVLGTAVTGNAQMAGAGVERPGHAADPLLGRAGIAATDLRPNGQVEIDGRRYEASVEIGAIDAGRSVRVVGRNSFVLLVAEVKS
jgi:membrane-bound serine protease (ClpP class)